MKIKKLMALAVAMLCTAGAWAQTDVTSTYLTNADFSQGTPVTVGVCTYDYDKESNSTNYANLVAVDGWTAVASANGKAGGLFAIGGGAWLGGKGFTAPATDSDGNTGVNVLGVVTCWGASVQYTQDLKQALPAGTYTLVLAAYNSGAGQNNVAANLIGFIEAGGTTHYATTTKYNSNTWKYEFIKFTLTAETSGKVSIGYTSTGTGSGKMPHLFVSGLTLFQGEVDAEAYEAMKTAEREAKEAKVLWDNAVAAANAALADEAYKNVTGAERTALQAEVAKAEPSTKDDYNAATTLLGSATMAFEGAKSAYDALLAEIAYAKTFNVATTDAETVASSTTTTAADALTAAQNLKVAEYNAINAAYPNDVTSLLGPWSAGNYGTTSGEGYIGSESYFDKWNGSALDLTSSATVTLPAGKYVVKVAGRGVPTTTMSMSVKVGDAEAVSTPFLLIGNTGKGIDTAGATNFSEEGTYSNENNGRGWQYRYIAFETTGEDVTIAINGHLEGNTWQSFYAPVLLCDNATFTVTELIAAKANLKNAIDAAPAAATANVGTAAFQLPAAGVTAYSEALAAAQDAYDDTEATKTTLEAAKTALENAITAYNALEVNAPADGQLFNVVLTFAEWTYDNKAMTFLANDRTDGGNYNIQYKEEANQNLAQAFTFTKVEGNKYTMSQIDADGNARYLSTGVPYGGNTSQIRTVTDAAKALKVEIIPTATEGVWNLRNTEANNYIGSQDAGVYTVNSHIDFKLVETSKPSITINTTAAGWGTVMLPFAAATLPSGVKAYTCAAAEGNTLTLTEATEIVANKPYIIEGAWNQTLTGDAQGTALTYTEGLLTGVYSDRKVEVGKYVMQNQKGLVGFFKVEEGAQPTIKANHAYVTAPAAGDVKAFILGDATAIQGVNAAQAENAAIYNVAGQRVQKAVKGLYIINGKKVMVK